MDDIKFNTYRENDINKKITCIGVRPLDIMITGVTGAGKSTTLNAFFQKIVAKVGDGVDPETMELDAYALNNYFRIWDTPGLGDGIEIDKIHKKKITDLLHKIYFVNEHMYAFIDLVIVIIEGSTRDMGTTYTLLNEIIIPNIQKDRILVIINQADIAMKGYYWDNITKSPDPQLISFLNEKAISVKEHVKEATGVDILTPVYYSAEYNWNVKAVFDFIIDHIPLEKRKLYSNEKNINIMITGETGCGKSSTINDLFDLDIAKIGTGPKLETMEITRYDLDNLVLWDTPGLGDGREADARHTKNIINKLLEKDEKGNLLIDLVLIILDGSSRDLGTSYELINNVIIPNLGEDKNRVLIAINQADIAMKGRYWNHEENKPEPELVEFLEQKVKSVHERIKEGTGLDITPIYYSAGFKEEGGSQEKPYNLSKLLYYIIKLTPKNKRLPYIENINKNPAMWEDDDNLINYKKDIISELSNAVEEGVIKGSNIGGTLGELILGEKGKTVGKIAGAAAGAVTGLIVGGLKIIFNL